MQTNRCDEEQKPEGAQRLVILKLDKMLFDQKSVIRIGQGEEQVRPSAMVQGQNQPLLP